MKLVLLLAVLTMASSSFAGWVHGETWNCDLDLDAKGYRVGIFVGVQSLEGQGTLKCESNRKKFIEHDVYLYSGGFQFGFSNVRISKVHFSAVGIGLANPKDFFGKYNVGLTAGASLDSDGNEFDAGFALKKGGLGLELGASETKLSKFIKNIPLVDAFAGIKAMRFSDKPL